MRTKARLQANALPSTVAAVAPAAPCHTWQRPTALSTQLHCTVAPEDYFNCLHTLYALLRKGCDSYISKFISSTVGTMTSLSRCAAQQAVRQAQHDPLQELQSRDIRVQPVHTSSHLLAHAGLIASRHQTCAKNSSSMALQFQLWSLASYAVDNTAAVNKTQQQCHTSQQAA